MAAIFFVLNKAVGIFYYTFKYKFLNCEKHLMLKVIRPNNEWFNYIFEFNSNTANVFYI